MGRYVYIDIMATSIQKLNSQLEREEERLKRDKEAYDEMIEQLAELDDSYDAETDRDCIRDRKRMDDMRKRINTIRLQIANLDAPTLENLQRQMTEQTEIRENAMLRIQQIQKQMEDLINVSPAPAAHSPPSCLQCEKYIQYN